MRRSCSTIRPKKINSFNVLHAGSHISVLKVRNAPGPFLYTTPLPFSCYELNSFLRDYTPYYTYLIARSRSPCLKSELAPLIILTHDQIS